MSNTKKITIFSQRLCGYLMTKGFVLIGMSKGTHDKSKNVFSSAIPMSCGSLLRNLKT